MNPISMAVDGMAYRAPPPPPPPPPPRPPAGPVPVVPAGRGGTPAGPGPYGLPPGTGVGDVVRGTRAEPFDVTLSRLATAVYSDGPGDARRPGPPQPWHAVDDAELRAHGIDDPQAWRHQYLGGGEETSAQHFKAEIYTDGDGNYVLAYRGTDGTGADWMNNFKQGTGFETEEGNDKFSGMAARTARQFKLHFADPGGGNNLAITGHSQGGGLATVGSVVSGIPAVTFDASGIHPNTWDRLGIDPQAARDIAENGTIRAYSLHDDLLTRAQESGPLGLMTPDALGTKIVVAPAGEADAGTIAHGLDVETGLPDALTGPVGTALEVAHRIPAPLLAGEGAVVGGLFGGPVGFLAGGAIGGAVGLAGDGVRGAVSHSPVLLTEAMIQQQPWQPGYENPADIGKGLQDLVPDPLKDDYARNVHATVEGIADVVRSDFADGDYVQGGFRIAGDVGKGFVDSAGDTVQRGSEAVGDAVEQRVGGPVGKVFSAAADGFGRVVDNGLHVVGHGVEAAFDAGGKVMQTVADGARSVIGFFTGRPG